MDLSTSLSHIAGIGPTFVKRLQYLGLFKVEDLINHYPFRYDDFSQNKNVSSLTVGETVTLQGELWSIKNTYTRFRKVLTQAIINDGTGTVDIVWFNQPWLTKNLQTGDRIQVSGKVNKKGNRVGLVAPAWEKITSDQPSAISYQTHTGRLVPIYPETYGLSSKWLRYKISQVLPVATTQLDDPIPESITKNMLPLTKALQQIHFPDSFEAMLQAKKRLSFDELFYINLSTIKKRNDWKDKKLVKPWQVDEEKLNTFTNNLPFILTSAQQKVVNEIISDIKKEKPMNRLLQGEVGSGKTVVAAIISFLGFLNGLKTVVMAPTEILAFQHYKTLSGLLSPYGMKIGIYTGSRKFTKSLESRVKSQENKKPRLSTLATSPSIIIGTHALLSDKLDLDNIGLVVVDEQQRFGVEQRSMLRNRTKSPHFLTMTATPIPRTVALTLYGDLDLSIIDELPKGRKQVKTYFVPAKRRADSYKFIGKHIDQGSQVYIITPLIEESETQTSAKAAKVEYERLKKEVFPHFRLGLLHGRLKSKEKEEVINDFKDHKIDILVSTSVVEVGVDVPNATIMVIEGAERFGLAQLHQLRGRVGRGDKQSFALLFTETEDQNVTSRVKNLEKIYDGLKLAELDLKIRGSGEIFGLRQSGRWELKIASLSDLPLIEEARLAAIKLLQDNPNLDKYPKLSAKLSGLTKGVMPD